MENLFITHTAEPFFNSPFLVELKEIVEGEKNIVVLVWPSLCWKLIIFPDKTPPPTPRLKIT